jgi:capsular polysaccharide biosynthesis protein
MNQQAFDLRRFLRTIWLRRVIVLIAVLAGIAAGTALGLLRPPVLTAKTLVVLPPTATRYTGTQVYISDSEPVLNNALRSIDPPLTLAELRNRVTATSPTSELIQLSAKAGTAAEAENIVNAVAASYVTYISSASNPGGQVLGHVLAPAVTAQGTSRPVHLITTGLIGAVVGLIIGAIIALARGRGDTRLRTRDEIADALGVPVLASLPVGHPSDTAGWAVLLSAYEPGVVHAWGMRKALHHLGLTDFRGGSAASLAVISLSSDPAAIALGPQLAIYAATLGIPTELVIGPQQDADATASLRAACAVPTALPPEPASQLKIVVEDQPCADRQPESALSIVVIVVDSRAPRLPETMRTTVSVLGASSGAVTAEQLARAAASAAGDGREVAGIIVADPDPADHTTGRMPQAAPPSHRRPPTRLTGTAMETRR